MDRFCVAIYEPEEQVRKTLHELLVAYAIQQNTEVVIHWLKGAAEEKDLADACTQAQLALISAADGALAAQLGILLHRINGACGLIYYGDGARQDVAATVDYFSRLIPAAPIRYLHRPTAQDFSRALWQFCCQAGQEHFLWENKGMKYRVPYGVIQYFRSDRNYVYLHLTSGTEYSFLGKLSNLERQLPPQRFVRVHQSYLVNLAEIVAIDKQQKAVCLRSGDTLFISKARYKQTMAACGPD